MIPFKVELEISSYDKLDFNTASNDVVSEISKNHKNLYLSLSGGLDSEYLLRLFHRNRINIIPVIVVHESNSEELSYAFRVCDELNITPIKLFPNDIDISTMYSEKIVKIINGCAIYSVFAMMAAEYVLSKRGVLITGNHLIGDQGDPTHELSSNEWDFYTEMLYPELINIDPLCYDPTIVYSMIKSIDDDWGVHKAKLYNVIRRNKMQPNYNDITGLLNNINNNKRHFANPKWTAKISEVFA